MRPTSLILALAMTWGALFSGAGARTAAAAESENDWEITPASEAALERGLKWLAANQGPEGNWESNDLGLVSMGTLAFLSAGHTPGRGKYGAVVEKSLSYVLRNAKPSGLLNIADGQRDMYNHGLSTFVLGQANGMTSDQRISPVLDRALKLISATQCRDGGWDYHAATQDRGHDLSLAVMQAKALRSAADSGLEVPPEVTELAIRSVREHYASTQGRRSEAEMKKLPGQFTYSNGQGGTPAMAAAGVVCLQEFGQYDDWRIPKSMEAVSKAVSEMKIDKNKPQQNNQIDAYTTYYVGQAIYQVGGKNWKESYPVLRDYLIAKQSRSNDAVIDGKLQDTRVGGKPGELYGTAVACFILAIPNRYLPILQEGKIDSIKPAAKN